MPFPEAQFRAKNVDIRHGQCYNVDNRNEAKEIFSLRVR